MVVLTVMGTALFGFIGKVVYASIKPDVTQERLNRLETKVEILQKSDVKGSVIDNEILRRLEDLKIKLDARNQWYEDVSGDLKVIKYRLDKDG